MALSDLGFKNFSALPFPSSRFALRAFMCKTSLGMCDLTTAVSRRVSKQKLNYQSVHWQQSAVRNVLHGIFSQKCELRNACLSKFRTIWPVGSLSIRSYWRCVLSDYATCNSKPAEAHQGVFMMATRYTIELSAAQQSDCVLHNKSDRMPNVFSNSYYRTKKAMVKTATYVSNEDEERTK